MTKEQIFEVVRGKIKEILLDVPDEDIVMDSNLEELGANSVDRADIVTECMQALHLDLSPKIVAGAKDVGSLVTLFHQSGARV